MHYKFTFLVLSMLLASCAAPKQEEQAVPSSQIFFDGTICDQCDYIYRETLKNSHKQETAIKNKKYNGEQREFENGKLVRLAHFSDNHKNGVEYFYENGTVKDSVKQGWFKGKELTLEKFQDILPRLLANRFEPTLKELAASSTSEAFAEVKNGLATKIGEKRMDSVNYVFFEITYDRDDPQKNFLLKTNKDYFIVKKDTIIEEKQYDENVMVTDFKFRDHYYSYYKSKLLKERHEGDVAVLTDKATCIGKCHVTSFNESGIKYIEYWQEVYDSAGVRQDKILSKSYKKGTSLEFELHTLNGETISYKFFDENGNLSTEYNKSEFYFIYNDKGNIMHEFLGTSRSEGKKIFYIDGVETIYLPNGLPFAIFNWKDGKAKQVK